MHTRTPKTGSHARPAVPSARRRERPDDGDAFLPDPEGGPARAPDDFAELVAEDYVAAATSGEEQGETERNRIVPEELGGPFLQSSAEEELVDDTDGTNPEGADAEPFPRAMGGRS